ncbi:MAG: RNA polymerase sigma factor [Dysgonamonadaceae bacterium]|jgi:RNA polymerase sigma-70 factor (ECF subfamily)|nr:RNA polymerase sigma factor [Dysgonamonadaceae bacterium]
MTEPARVQQVLSGNTSAFTYFVEAYQDMAITIAYRVCGNMQDAEDVVQDSFVKAYRNLHAFRGESKFSSWLYRIVYNTATSFTHAKMWQSDADLSKADENPSDFDTERQLETAETAGLVNDTLRRMPPGEALLLTLYYLDDNPVKEIAKITGLNETNVKVKLFRARKLFRELLPKELITASKLIADETFTR